MQFIKQQPGAIISLNATGDLYPPAHILDADSINAVNAAIAAQRPLLVRGEPGVGKSQLARAAAKALGWAYVPFVVDARTESRDLLWHFDAVERLAEAQLQGVMEKDRDKIRSAMAVEKFIRPGPLWWGFNWDEATTQAEHLNQQPPAQSDAGDPEQGCVVLIDEIDKAESDVPNGLLEALGVASFTPQGRNKPVTVCNSAPLVIITTNEERLLPDAFLRRCLVLALTLPEARDDFIDCLKRRGLAHFQQTLDEDLLQQAAELVATDRSEAIEQRLTPLPGVAEYLDLCRAMLNLPDQGSREEQLQQIAAFTVRKHPELQQDRTQ